MTDVHDNVQICTIECSEGASLCLGCLPTNVRNAWEMFAIASTLLMTINPSD